MHDASRARAYASCACAHPQHALLACIQSSQAHMHACVALPNLAATALGMGSRQIEMRDAQLRIYALSTHAKHVR
eukprot:4168238-Pleurochrysis_carterae.AAC.4